MRVCGARRADTAGRRECVEERARPICPAGMEIADGQGNVEGQPLGMPGIWQGASSEQGVSPEDGADSLDRPDMSDIGAADSCAARVCVSPGDIANTRPPATIRWRADKPARSAANRRRRTIAVKLSGSTGTVKIASVDSA